MNTIVVLVVLFAVATADTQWNPPSTAVKPEHQQKPTHVVGSSPVAYTTTYATGAPVQWNGHQWTQWDEQQQQWNTVPVTKSAWNTQQPSHNWNSNWNTQSGQSGANARALPLWSSNVEPSQSHTWNGNNWNTAVPVARSGSWSSGTPSHTWTTSNNWNTVPVARSAWSPSSSWSWNTASVPTWNGWNTYASSWPWTYYVAA